jgi:hypothetical protein
MGGISDFLGKMVPCCTGRKVEGEEIEMTTITRSMTSNGHINQQPSAATEHAKITTAATSRDRETSDTITPISKPQSVASDPVGQTHGCKGD